MNVDLKSISGSEYLYVVLKRALHKNYYTMWDKSARDRLPVTQLREISDHDNRSNRSVLGKRTPDST